MLRLFENRERLEVEMTVYFSLPTRLLTQGEITVFLKYAKTNI